MKGEVNVQYGNSEQERIVASRLTEYNAEYSSLNYSVKYVTKGAEHYIIDGKRHVLKPNQFMMVNPNQHIEIEIGSELPVHGHCFFIDPNMLNRITTNRLISQNKSLSDPTYLFENPEYSNIPINQLGSSFEYLQYLSLHNDVYNQNEISDFLISIGESIVDQQKKINTESKNIQCAKPVTRLELFRRIQLGRDFIHDNYSKNISLHEISAAAYLSEYHFHRSFRSFFDQTPFQYLKSIRLNKAKELIALNQYPLEEISSICGYIDLKYFRKICRQNNLI